MKKIKDYLSLIKFSHSIFALPFAVIGFVLAINVPFFLDPSWGNKLSKVQKNNPYWPANYSDPKYDFLNEGHNKPIIYTAILCLLCMIFARSAAMAFNRYLDRSIDAKNPRTIIREIPSGIIAPKNALLFTIICSLAFVVCCYFINTLCFYLSFVALAVVLGYSYTKRFTPLCHLVLGLGLSLAPIGAYIAVTNQFDTLPILFSFVVLFWVSGFDIIYALQDEEFDRANNLKSIPVLLGAKNALNLSRFFHIAAAVILLVIGLLYPFHFLYWIGAALFGALLIRQHSIIRYNELSKVNIAFFTLNGFASIVFAIFVIMDLILKN
jgi:4-hydroxybenzoate polyprenyltransferase